MPTAAGVYDRSRDRVTALISEVDPRTPIPACPSWTAEDLLAHLVGIAEDVVAGSVDDLAGPATTAAQVSRHTGAGVTVLVDHWADLAPALHRAAADPEINERSFAPLGLVLMYDLYNHEQDLRTATENGTVPPGADLPFVLEVAVAPLRRRYTSGALPALALETTDGSRWVAGTGPPCATVRASPFELFRALSGRRTAEEVCRLDWRGDPTVHLRHWLSPVFDWPETPCGP